MAILYSRFAQLHARNARQSGRGVEPSELEAGTLVTETRRVLAEEPPTVRAVARFARYGIGTHSAA